MIRSLAVATAATFGLAAPALAADSSDPGPDTASVQAFYGQLNARAKSNEMRKLLYAQGYTAVSDLNRDANGRWIGTAMKDGKQVIVGVKFPPKPETEGLTN